MIKNSALTRQRLSQQNLSRLFLGYVKLKSFITETNKNKIDELFLKLQLLFSYR